MTFQVLFKPASRDICDDDSDSDCSMNDGDIDEPDCILVREAARTVSTSSATTQKNVENGDDNDLDFGESWVPFRPSDIVFGSTDNSEDQKCPPPLPPRPSNKSQPDFHHYHRHLHKQKEHDSMVQDAKQRVIFHPSSNPPIVHDFDWEVDFRPTTVSGSKRKTLEQHDDEMQDSGHPDISMLEDGSDQDHPDDSTRLFVAEFAPSFFPDPELSSFGQTPSPLLSPTTTTYLTVTPPPKTQRKNPFLQWARGRSSRSSDQKRRGRRSGINNTDYTHRPTKRIRLTPLDNKPSPSKKTNDDHDARHKHQIKYNSSSPSRQQITSTRRRKRKGQGGYKIITDIGDDYVQTMHQRKKDDEQIHPRSILRKKSSYPSSAGNSYASVSICGSLDLDLNTTLDSHSTHGFGTAHSNISSSSVDSGSVFERNSMDTSGEGSRKKIRIVDSRINVVQRLVRGSLLAFGGSGRNHDRRHHTSSERLQSQCGHLHRNYSRTAKTKDDQQHPDQLHGVSESSNSSSSSYGYIFDETNEKLLVTTSSDNMYNIGLTRMPSSILSSDSSLRRSSASWKANDGQQSTVDSNSIDIDCDESNSWMPPTPVRRPDVERTIHSTAKHSSDTGSAFMDTVRPKELMTNRKTDPPGDYWSGSMAEF